MDMRFHCLPINGIKTVGNDAKYMQNGRRQNFYLYLKILSLSIQVRVIWFHAGGRYIPPFANIRMP